MDLSCSRCGNCCPKDCSEFEIVQADPVVTSCREYPRGSCGFFCPKPPAYYFGIGIACRTGIRAALEMNPDLEFTLEEDPNGQIGYDISKIPLDIIKSIRQEWLRQYRRRAGALILERLV